MPSSLVFAALVLAWLVVLVPVIARRRQTVPRPAEADLNARVLPRTAGAPLIEEVPVADAETDGRTPVATSTGAGATAMRRGGSTAVAEREIAEVDNDLDDELDRELELDAHEGGTDDDLDDRRTATGDRRAARAESRERVLARSGGSVRVADGRDDPDDRDGRDDRDDHPVRALRDVDGRADDRDDDDCDLRDDDRDEDPRDLRDDELDDDLRADGDLDDRDLDDRDLDDRDLDEDGVDEYHAPRPYRPGRGGFDPDAAAVAAHQRYAFRQRVALGLIAVAVLSALAALVVSGVLWGLFAVVALVLVGYLVFLRHQTRIEDQVRARRSARLSGERRALEARRARQAEHEARLAAAEWDDEDDHAGHDDYDEYDDHEDEAPRWAAPRTPAPPVPAGMELVDDSDEDPAFHDLGDRDRVMVYRRAAGA